MNRLPKNFVPVHYYLAVEPEGVRFLGRPSRKSGWDADISDEEALSELLALNSGSRHHSRRNAR